MSIIKQLSDYYSKSFIDNTITNQQLSKKNASVKNKKITKRAVEIQSKKSGEVVILERGTTSKVDTKEVLNELLKINLKVSDRTLRNYVKDKLIPTPIRKSLGQGHGKMSDYPDSTPLEFYGSWKLITYFKHNKSYVAKIRSLSLIGQEAVYDYFSILEYPPNKEEVSKASEIFEKTIINALNQDNSISIKKEEIESIVIDAHYWWLLPLDMWGVPIQMANTVKWS